MKKLAAVLLVAAFGATCALADIVYVTALPQNCTTTSACGNINTDGTYTEVNLTGMSVTGIHGTAAGRPTTPVDSRAYLSGTSFTDTTGGVDIKPVLAVNNTVYEIDYNWNSSAGNSSTNVVMSATATGGTLSFSSTPLFQRSYGAGTTWNVMGYITNTTTTPTISFRYQSGLVNATSANRLLFDCWRFQLSQPCLAVAAVGVTGPLGSDSTTVSVTGVSSSATKVTLYQGPAGGAFTNIGSLTVSSPGTTVAVPVTGVLVKGAQVGATQTIGGQEGCTPTAGTLVGGGYSPSIRICASIRETTGLSGPIGANAGGASADIYWIHATGGGGSSGPVGGLQITPSTNWQTIVFYPTDTRETWNGTPTLPDPNQYGSFEGFGINSADATDCGPIQIYFDNFRNASTLIQDFENQANGTATVMFNQPSLSGTTSGNLLTSPNTSAISQSYASTGTNSLGVSFQFAGLGQSAWLRLNDGTPATGTPNPEVDLTQPIMVDVLLLPSGQTVAHSLGQVIPTTAFQQTNCPASSATFGVAVTPPLNTTPTYTYVWKLNGTTVAGASTSTYTKSNLGSSDAGTYSVTVSDGVASATLNFVLVVLPPVSIDSQPVDQGPFNSDGTGQTSFNVSASIPDSCPCALNPSLGYQWFLNGKALSDGPTITGSTSSQIILSQVWYTNAGAYTCVVTSLCNGQTATSLAAQLTVTPVPNPVQNCGDGLLGLYYTNRNSGNAFTGSSTWTNVDPQISFDWGTGGPSFDPYYPTDYFAVRWVGTFQAPFDPGGGQLYTFWTTTDDGVRLYVNGQLLINKWVAQSATTWGGSILLTTNAPVPIIMEYFEQTGSAVADLAYSSPSVVSNIIPEAQFCAADPISDIPPFVTLSAPANNSSGQAGVAITLTAAVTQNTAPVNNVKFWNGAALLATVTQSGSGNYSTSWAPPAPGVYTISAVVTYQATNTLPTVATNKFTATLTPTPVTIGSITNNGDGTITIGYTGGNGSQFILVNNPNLRDTRDIWAAVQTNNATPGSFTVTPATNGFYSIKSK